VWPGAAAHAATFASSRLPAGLVGPVSDVTPVPGNQDENTVAINPTNTKNIVALSTADNGSPGFLGGLVEGYTFDGGATWTNQVIADGTDGMGPACCDESLSFDQNGHLFLTYLDNEDGNVPIAESLDGGVTFSIIHVVVPTIPALSAEHPAPNKAPRRGKTAPVRAIGSADQPTITTGANSVWVTYTSFSLTSSAYVIQAAGAAVAPDGSTSGWVGPESVASKLGRGDYGDIAIGPSGQVVVIYQNPTGGEGPATIYTSLDSDGLGPKGFSQTKALTQTNVGGFDYIPAQSERSIDAEANMAWDRDPASPHYGRLYAVWTSETPNESNDTNIMFQWTDNMGVTWSPPVRLNNDSLPASQFMPAIAIDQSSGAVALSWHDCRNDYGNHKFGDTDGVPNDDAMVYGTFTKDGGATFAPNFQIAKGASNATDAGSILDYGDYTHATFSHGLFYPVWSDNSNSTGTNPDGKLHAFDLYTAKITIGA
jgi:hypothetical protein